jgi:hypothetical protein
MTYLFDDDIHTGRERRNKLACAVEFEHQETDNTVMHFWVWYDVDPADPDVGIFSETCVVTEAECFKITNDDGPDEVMEIAWESDGSRGDIVLGELLGVYLMSAVQRETIHEQVETACWDQRQAASEQYDEETER